MAVATMKRISLACALGLPACTVHDVKVKDTKVSNPAPPTELLLTVNSRAEAFELFDLAGIFGKPCPEKDCFIADLQQEFFKRDASGSWTVSESFMKSAHFSFAPTAIRIREAEASFNVEKSLAYGASDRFPELGLDQKCDAALNFGQGQSLDPHVSLEGLIETGKEENLAKELSTPEVYLDLKASLPGLSLSEAKKGSEVTVNFARASLNAIADAEFEDYESASGVFFIADKKSAALFKLKTLWAAVKNLLTENPLYAAIFPEGYPVPAPKNGYPYDPLHPSCNSPSPMISYTKTASTNAELCDIPGYAHCCEPSHLPRECPALPFSKTFVAEGRAISFYVSKSRSLRVVTGGANIDCRAQFRDIARIYEISGSWTAFAPNAQYFVSDPAWPSCGGLSCPQKFLRNSADDQRAADVEPAHNECLDRWQGLDYSSYMATLLSDCENTDIYRAAFKAKQANVADEDFARECKNDELCLNASNAMREAREKFSVPELKEKIVASEKALLEAKASGKSLVLRDSQLSAGGISSLSEIIAKLKTGLARVEELRKGRSPEADWVFGNNYVHGKGSIPGFQSYEESLKTLTEYEALLKKMSDLTAPSAKEIACSFTAKGRFRRYSDLSVKALSLEAQKPKTIKTILLKDYSP